MAVPSTCREVLVNAVRWRHRQPPSTNRDVLPKTVRRRRWSHMPTYPMGMGIVHRSLYGRRAIKMTSTHSHMGSALKNWPLRNKNGSGL